MAHHGRNLRPHGTRGPVRSSRGGGLFGRSGLGRQSPRQRRRARGPAQPRHGLILESLEPRRMLTFIIDNEYSWGSADVTIEDKQEIIVDGNWGNLNNNITLQAPKITFKDGASIETTGKVSLEASKMFPLVNLSLWNQIATIEEAIQPRDTTMLPLSAVA
jgi:hypothetical protein